MLEFKEVYKNELEKKCNEIDQAIQYYAYDKAWQLLENAIEREDQTQKQYILICEERKSQMKKIMIESEKVLVFIQNELYNSNIDSLSKYDMQTLNDRKNTLYKYGFFSKEENKLLTSYLDICEKQIARYYLHKMYMNIIDIYYMFIIEKLTQERLEILNINYK